MGNSVQKIIGLEQKISRLGQNMARKVGGRFLTGSFEGSIQRMGDKTVTCGRLDNYREVYMYTKISKDLPNGSRTASRMVPRYGMTTRGDVTKITNETTSNVGNFRVNTFNQKSYQYDDNYLYIDEKTIDRVFSGRHHLGGRAVYKHDTGTTTKYFFGKDGSILKTVHYDPQGLRTYAELPDGRIIRYDAKGLPTFTDARYGDAINLGGLDTLI